VRATLLAAEHASAAERILVDSSTGVMPLVAALAKAYGAKSPDVTVELGKGPGTRARLAALAEGKIHIALASHGLNPEELPRQGMMAHEIGKVAVVFRGNVGVGVPTKQQTRYLCRAPWPSPSSRLSPRLMPPPSDRPLDYRSFGAAIGL
jgi:ABC-type phosphate transport system substrate-binding protein